MKWMIAILLVCFLTMGKAEFSQAADTSAPPPPLQYTADCSRPVYATDHLVCNDPEIYVLDNDLRTLVRDRAEAISSSFIEPDADWFKRRSLCAFQADHRACVRGAYAERITILRGIATARPAILEPVRCTGMDASGMRRVGDALFLYDETGRPVVVAFPADAHRPWKDFAAYSRKAKRLSLTFIDGRGVRCDVRLARQ